VLIKGNILDLPFLQRTLNQADLIFHLAAVTSVPYSILDPEKTTVTNISGTLNILLAAREQGAKKVIYASSSAVYGDTPILPKTEDMAPNPQSPYAASKITGEYFCQVFRLVYNIPTVCLRYFNVYGPRQNPASQYAAVIPKFITSIKQGKPPTIYGDGEQKRDFTFVKDVVAANILAAESDATGVFNIGRGENTTINQLFQLCAKLIGKEYINPVYEAPKLGDIRESLADISKANSFGYCSKYNLEEGLQETIRSYSASS
jgi:UDP-glucose 4-epimerase